MLQKEYGAEYVMNSTKENFDQELFDLALKLKATVGLDAVAGDMPGRMLVCLGNGGTVINYGLLSGEKIGPINPIVMIFKG
jgi:NADPH:quinone reductase-like Zn-dependent oxidoreductase